jgi:hypothetical protein
MITLILIFGMQAGNSRSNWARNMVSTGWNTLGTVRKVA